MIFSHTANASIEELTDYAKALEGLVIEMSHTDLPYEARLEMIGSMVSDYNKTHPDFPIHIMDQRVGSGDKTRTNNSLS
ncbi:MAG TPA: hypothetical protein VNJ01_10705 [Bacteriovoracaceae bacterium]|nr:hypothetical protein [Bacteriovoracaceae bacterium]